MAHRRIPIRGIIYYLVLGLITLQGAAVWAGEDVPLLDASGAPLKPHQIDRVSIRKTCGGCHEVDALARSLHFLRP
ncbi:MAG: hypothetical protein ACP5R5_00885, partial [Armatimonadota bacterium]